MKRLFDPENGLLLLDEIVLSSPSYQAIIDDKVVTEEEIMEQAKRVAKMLKQIEDRLSAEDRDLVVDTVCELAVLYQVSMLKGGKKYGDI